MAVILETLSVKKLLALGVCAVAILCTFFFIGGTKAPPPTNAMPHIATVCNGKNTEAPLDPWSCTKVDLQKAMEDRSINPQDIVFAFQFPHRGLEMSRWHQFLALSVQMKLEYNKDNPYKTTKDGYPIWTFEAKLYYKDNNETADWNLLAKSTEERELVCHYKGDKSEGGYYNCDDLPFFEIGSVFYNYYLVNVRLPGYRSKNRGIGQVSGLEFVEIHQNGGFTQMWFTMKSVVAPVSIILLVWFAMRVKKLRREILLLEKTLFMLGFITAFLNLPLEWMTLYANMPFMLLFTDIRQGLFYAMLMCFWVIFTGEHLLDQAERNKIKAYLPQVCFIGFGGFCLLVFDVCERGYQLHNPFFSIWATKLGSDLAYGFIISAGVCASLYFLFLLVLVVKVFLNIRGKRATFKNMSRARRLNYEGLIFRFEFLMVVTLLCAALTVIFFIITNVNEAHWRFGEEESSVEISSALFTGIYGMWNVYVLTVMFLYAPTATDPVTAQYDANRETVELTGAVDPTSGARESIVYAMAGKTAQE
ncbi:protein wntless homolog [Exaiptasia diaphana]|uniref:Protein wntless n=1 Tax=Exaiptasia diaphana TaxID=2652724 RepID=A0A913X6V4_EXADI|nr:protein wntless homolog [Exaiptasia diaphana]KXJ14740.1 Protein wntless-like [Exaiptasia diaphana]